MDARSKLIRIGIHNLKERGFDKVTEGNLFSNEQYVLNFMRMLREHREDMVRERLDDSLLGKTIIDEINNLILSCQVKLKE